jgi:hypothetical protein
MAIFDAIRNLRPNTEFTLVDDDVENIVWHTPNVKPLTLAEVEKESKRIEAEALAKRESVESKLAALGLTADDLKVLGL